MPDDSLLGQFADEFIQETRQGKLPDLRLRNNDFF
jgi:hypothetical protein